MDKSPLAMLEKTCETIGLPDTPAKKSSPKNKDSSPSNDGKKKDLETIVTKSPRLNPIPNVDKKVRSLSHIFFLIKEPFFFILDDDAWL